jgi:hypothetical protein
MTFTINGRVVVGLHLSIYFFSVFFTIKIYLASKLFLYLYGLFNIFLIILLIFNLQFSSCYLIIYLLLVVLNYPIILGLSNIQSFHPSYEHDLL